jgi:O-antigen/teichoic acid export membrane protein
MDSDALLYGVFSVAIQFAMKGSVVVAALVRPDYQTAVWASVGAVAAVVIGFVVVNRRHLFPPGMRYSFLPLRRLQGLFVYSVYTWPIPVLLYVHVVVTQIIIRASLGHEAVGLFTSVAVFVGVVSAFQAGFATYWSGYMYRNYQTQVARIAKMHDYLALFVVVSMTLFVLLRDLAFLLLGSGYQATKPWFALLLVYPLLLILSETTAYGMGIAKKSHLMVMVTLSSVVSNVVITWALVPHWGLLGACVGSVVSGVILFAGQTYFGQKYFRSISNEWRTVFAVVAILVLSVANLIFSDRPASRAGFAILGLGVSLAVYWKASGEIVSLTRGVLRRPL